MNVAHQEDPGLFACAWKSADVAAAAAADPADADAEPAAEVA
jgi:hypothetical protein